MNIKLPPRIYRHIVFLTVTLPAISFGSGEITINGKSVHDYLPVLPETRQRAFSVDPETGMYVAEIKPKLFLVSDGVFQSAFLNTDAGVVVFDAPQRYSNKLPQIIDTHTSGKPVKYLIYSHGHNDHIGGATVFGDIDNLNIIAHQHVAEELNSNTATHQIPLPTVHFHDQYTLSLGGEKVELKYHGNFHSLDADILIHLPKQRFLYAIDTVGPGYVPFKGLGFTANVQRYTTIFDDILTYDFDTFVGGHLNIVGRRQDIADTRDYVRDVATTAKHILDTTRPGPFFEDVFNALDNSDNVFLAYSYYLETIAKQCAGQLINRWQHRLSGVDVWAENHCASMHNHLLMN